MRNLLALFNVLIEGSVGWKLDLLLLLSRLPFFLHLPLIFLPGFFFVDFKLLELHLLFYEGNELPVLQRLPPTDVESCLTIIVLMCEIERTVMEE